jgi:Winged helix-turn-helix domain (DUF2582)
MRNVVDEFGENAGKIWQALHSQGPLQHIKLMRTTKLNTYEVYSAIGWLARENKINISSMNNGKTYTLGETNLTGKIGTDAGHVWKTLNTHGESDISTLARYTKLDSEAIFSALGWLARENKLHAYIDKNQQIKFTLKEKVNLAKK